jgi:8-oxo-dGTP pyrophosphatase MutT (NUDIX family)
MLDSDASNIDPIRQLEDDLRRVAGDPARFPRTTKLIAAGAPQQAKKMVEAAAELAIEAVRCDRDAAVREAAEEAGVPATLLAVRFTSVLDLGYWSYTTVVADASERFPPVVSDPESIELRWVPIGAVDELPLHPRFAESWPALRSRL